jgi:hypothetical protein
METSLQAANRLLIALEELVMQETMLIHSLDFVEAVSVRERTGPLVERLCMLAADATIARMRPRVALLLDRWSENHRFLDTQLSRVQDELSRMTEARGRLRRVVPAYLSQSVHYESRLNTAA